MNIKEIRQLTGLSQNEFANKYDIPVRTLVNWELPDGNPNKRNAPRYLVKLLERIVREDFEL